MNPMMAMAGMMGMPPPGMIPGFPPFPMMPGMPGFAPGMMPFMPGITPPVATPSDPNQPKVCRHWHSDTARCVVLSFFTLCFLLQIIPIRLRRERSAVIGRVTLHQKVRPITSMSSQRWIRVRLQLQAKTMSFKTYYNVFICRQKQCHLRPITMSLFAGKNNVI